MTLSRAHLASISAALLLSTVACGGGQEPAAPSFSRDSIAERSRAAQDRLSGERAPRSSERESHAETNPEPSSEDAPVSLQDVNEIQRQYPSSIYILGIGESGEGALAAEYAARAQIVRQIQSELVTTIQIETSGTLANPETTVQEAVSETSRFDRGELITLDRDASSCAQNRCVAIAYIDRQSAAQILLDELAPLLEEYQRTVDRALATSDPWSFTPLWRAIYSQSDRLHARLQLIQSVAGQRPEALVTLRQQERTLADKRSILMGRYTLALGELDIADAPVRSRLDETLRRTLGEAGAAMGSAGMCAEGARVDVSAEVQCQRAFMGIRCSLEGDISSHECTSGRELGRARLSGCAQGAHPSDESRAREALTRSLQEDSFRTCIRNAFGSWWPLD